MEVEGRDKPDTLKEVWRWVKQLLQDFLDNSAVKKKLLFESNPDFKHSKDKENEREKCLNMPQIMANSVRSPSDQARQLLTQLPLTTLKNDSLMSNNFLSPNNSLTLNGSVSYRPITSRDKVLNFDESETAKKPSEF